MIYLIGDTHGEMEINKISLKYIKRQGLQAPKADDKVIILGDFGFPFLTKQQMEKRGALEEYKYWMDYMDKYPCQILFIDGNHDNHDFWDKQKITNMYGGKVQLHPDSSNVVHLMRGEVYEIDEKHFLPLVVQLLLIRHGAHRVLAGGKEKKQQINKLRMLLII